MCVCTRSGWEECALVKARSRTYRSTPLSSGIVLLLLSPKSIRTYSRWRRCHVSSQSYVCDYTAAEAANELLFFAGYGSHELHVNLLSQNSWAWVGLTHHSFVCLSDEQVGCCQVSMNKAPIMECCNNLTNFAQHLSDLCSTTG